MKKTLTLLLISTLMFSACAGRVPSPKTAQKLVQKNFVKYGKKYKDSDFGKHKVEKVEISKIEEIQKSLAAAEAYAYLHEGSVYWVRVTLQKRTFGWKATSWETLGVR